MKNYDVKLDVEEVLTNSVFYKGNFIRLNQKMIADRGVSSEDIKTILMLHKKKLMIEHEMDQINAKCDWQFELLRSLDTKLKQLEYALQAAWGFPQNSDYHRFWERPHCTCPKMDNDDRYPTGHYVISGDCPLHGTVSGSPYPDDCY